jgi:hypothetical protein
MGCEYICDGCGTRKPADFNGRDYIKPRLWFMRSDKDGGQVACSRPCIETVASKTGKPSVVLPV